MAQTPVQGSKIPIPIPELGIGLSLFAGYLKTSAGQVRTAGADVKTAWSGMSSVYHAPEDVQLLTVMDPVATTTDSFATDVEAVAKALETFAAEAEPLQNTLRNAQGQANAFDAKVKGDGKWDHDGGKVKENNDILHTVNTTLVAYQAAERKAANAIERLIGGHTWHVADPHAKHQDKYAYGYSSIPDNTKTPWGRKVSKKDGCVKSSLKGVGHFVEGAAGSLWGMVSGLGDLVGFGGWKKFKQSWQGLNTIVQLIDVPAGLAQYGPKGYLKRLTAVGKSLIDFNEWKTDPAKAAGNSITTVLTAVIPVAGQVGVALDATRAAKVAADASDAGKAGDAAAAANDAGKLGKAGSLAKTAALNFSKYTDPFHYAGQLPKVVNVVKGLGIKIPDMLVVDAKGATVLDHQLSGLDHTPTHTPEPAMTGAHTGTGTIDHAGTGSVDHAGSGTVDHSDTGTLDHGGAHDPGHAGAGHSGAGDGTPVHGSGSSDAGAAHPGHDGGGDSAPGGSHPGSPGTDAGHSPGHPQVDHDVTITHDKPTTAFAARTDLAPHTAYHVEGRGTFYTDGTGRVTYVETEAGKTGALNGDLLHPQPDVTYVVDGRHIYHTDGLARTDHVHVDQLQVADADRSSSIQGRIGRAGGTDYEGGHLIANVFGGGPEDHNLVAMLREVNRGKGDSFGNLEKNWLSQLKADPSTKITVDIRPEYIGDSRVPSEVYVEYSVNGGPTETRFFING